MGTALDDHSNNEKRSRLLALVMKMSEARIRGQFEILESVATEDVVVRLVGNRALSPFAGVFNGVQAARASLENLSIEFEYRNMKLDHLMIDGNQVGMRWSGTLRNRGTSAQALFEGFVHIIFRGDLICEYTAFIDTAGMAHLADWHQMQA